MRNASPRTGKCLTTSLALAVALVSQLSVVQAASPTAVPEAPAGGIDPSKLPDVQGIHLGMSPQDVLPKFKALYPGNETTLAYSKIQGSSDPQWLARLNGAGSTCGSSNSCDNMMVVFSGPPGQQRVVIIQRSLGFALGHEASPDNIKAALINKYGPNPIVLGPSLLSWVLDEQGQPAVVAPAVARRRTQCWGSFQSYVSGGIPLNVQPLTPADTARLMVDPCRVGVVVYAQLQVGGMNGVEVCTGLAVNLSENSEDTRDFIATQEYLAQQTAALRQKQTKRAQQVAAPAM